MGLILKSDAFVNGAIAGKYGKESSDVQEGIPQLSFPYQLGRCAGRNQILRTGIY